MTLSTVRRWLGWADVVEAVDNNGDWRRGYVTAWSNRCKRYREGDAVPHTPQGWSTYSVPTCEGWYVNIAKGRLTGWTEKPIHRVWP